MIALDRQNNYEIILSEKFYLADIVESIVLEESLDEVAVRATISLQIPDGLVGVPDIRTGQKLDVSGPLFADKLPFASGYLLRRGVLWEKEREEKSGRHITLTAYDPSIYLAKSEDEVFWPKGSTASQRLRRYAQTWGISTGAIVDTGTPLAKAIHRSKPIWTMIMDELTETLKKGGHMHRPRMTAAGLELVRIGGNSTVWALETDRNLEAASSRESMDDAVTQVKVLGAADGDKRAKVLEVIKNDSNTSRYGKIQKVVQASKANATAEAKAQARSTLCGPLETHNLQGPDINTLRAGDAIYYDGRDLIVISVRHELGSPGKMQIEAGSAGVVRRRYYAQT
ncbi:MAG: phage portal protein [bacterium]|nr:phage portal protein [bacterium]